MSRLALLVLVALAAVACATLDQFKGLIQPPRFSESDHRPAEFRVLAPSSRQPLGGLGIRLWATVHNPNPFGFTLGTLEGTLFLEGARGATAEFPLGLPLEAGQESDVPLDLAVSFSDLPGLSRVAEAAARSEPIAYRFEGTIGVDAGRLGQPVFGPMTMLSGELSRR